MNAKALLIPIAAFALSATGVSAFNSDVLERAGLSQAQISAFEQARELRKEGDIQKAREVIVKAGIDVETLEAVREAMHAQKQATRGVIEEAIANNDYEAFLKAIAGSPLADIVNSKEDFEQFKQAHEYKEEGEMKKAKEIMEELGFKPRHKGFGLGHHFGGFKDKNKE